MHLWCDSSGSPSEKQVCDSNVIYLAQISPLAVIWWEWERRVVWSTTVRRLKEKLRHGWDWTFPQPCWRAHLYWSLWTLSRRRMSDLYIVPDVGFLSRLILKLIPQWDVSSSINRELTWPWHTPEEQGNIKCEPCSSTLICWEAVSNKATKTSMTDNHAKNWHFPLLWPLLKLLLLQLTSFPFSLSKCGQGGFWFHMMINKSRVLIFSGQSLNCQLIWRRRLQTVSDVASLCKLTLMVKLSVGWNPCLDLINVKSFRTLLKGHKHNPHEYMNVSDYTWPTCVSPVNTIKERSNVQVEETKDSPRRDTVLIRAFPWPQQYTHGWSTVQTKPSVHVLCWFCPYIFSENVHSSTTWHREGRCSQ